MTEGNAYTNILKIIKNHGYNKDISFFIGEVASSKPTYNINGIIVGKEDVVLAKSAEVAKTGDKIISVIDGTSIFILDKVVE